jgi:kumamolisin
MSSLAYKVIEGSHRVPVNGAKAVGPISAEEWVEVTLTLRRVAPLPEPKARGTTLTREALSRQHGASQADVDKVVGVLRARGLEIVEASASGRRVRASGPARVIESVFGVKLMKYAHAAEHYRGRVGPVHVPAELDGIVVGVFGLDNRRVARKRHSNVRFGPLASTKNTARPWFFPEELAQIYAFPSGDGAGETVGVLEFGGGYFAEDLDTFLQGARITARPAVIPVSVNGSPTDARDGQEGEVMLDVEVLAGACPKAKIVLYFSTFDEKGWVDAIQAAVHDAQNHPSVLSISWGYAEDSADAWTAQARTQIAEALKEAALLGMTVFVASGDDGSSDAIGDGHAHADFPAVVQYVTAVGGTTLRAKGGVIESEVAWKDSDGLRKDGGGSSGGGVSALLSRPAWQKVDVASVNPGSIVGRCIPDVAADASAHTGYYVVVDGRGGVSGGTSASAPLWAALVLRANAALNAVGLERVGYLTQWLYEAESAALLSNGAVVCRDVAAGDNVTAHVGGYRSGKGYDAVTGWGTPDGGAFLAALQSPSAGARKEVV